MENASKALLIAGSILIVIALIALAVRTVSIANKPGEQLGATMETTEIATFNSKFTAYAGNGKSSAQVRALANIVVANNATNKENIVKFQGYTNATQITNYAASISGFCDVTLEYNSNGMVSNIKIGTGSSISGGAYSNNIW